MAKPRQTYLYLNRKQRIPHRASISQQRYNMARVTAQRACQDSEKLFEETLSNLLARDLSPIQRHTVELTIQLGKEEFIPLSSLHTWIESDELQEVVLAISHASRCGRLVILEQTDERNIGRLRTILVMIKNYDDLERTMAKLSKEVSIATSTHKANVPDQSAAPLYVLPLLTIIAALLSQLIRWQKD